MDTDCHLYTLPQMESDDNNDTDSDESDIEVISVVDETDNIAISIQDHFNLNDDDDEEDNNDKDETDVQQSSSVLNSNDAELDEDLNDLNQILYQMIDHPHLLLHQLHLTRWWKVHRPSVNVELVNCREATCDSYARKIWW